METGGYRVTLEELWRRKVDQIVVLSMAYHDDLPPGSASALTSRHDRGDALLMNRVIRAHQDLAMIEDAIDRIEAGAFGTCGSCAEPMCADWLTETPYARDCPNCCLGRLRWRSAKTAPSTAVPRARAG